MKKPLSLFLLAAASCLISGCASTSGGSSNSSNAGVPQNQAMAVRPATVEEVRPIQMEGKRTATSSAAGSATREAVRESFSIGGFRLPFGSQAASVGSAAVEETVSRQKGIEIMLKLDSGDHLVIAQADKGENFQPGERVKIVGDDKNARVMR